MAESETRIPGQQSLDKVTTNLDISAWDVYDPCQEKPPHLYSVYFMLKGSELRLLRMHCVCTEACRILTPTYFHTSYGILCQNPTYSGDRNKKWNFDYSTYSKLYPNSDQKKVFQIITTNLMFSPVFMWKLIFIWV